MPPATDSERYLAALCRRSFLSLWSYPNLYTDEGKPRTGQGRELCDLLVVFGHDVLIFSDKHVAYKDTGDVNVDWPRWCKRAVLSSMRQLYGAESWLRRFSGRVFLDARCAQPFPLTIPSNDQARYHRIAVTRGSFEACKKHFAGHSIGSLMLSSEPGAEQPLPFQVGVALPDKPYVHVFDEFTLDLLFEHLDTLADFVNYLRKKEVLMSTPAKKISVAGEEQLLAIYLKSLNEQGEHDFVLPRDIPSEVDHIHFAEGYWEEIKDAPQLMAKRDADRVSYLWDQLIERFIHYGGLRVFGMEIDQGPTDRELALRHMAAEPRMRRRQLSDALVEVRNRSGPKNSYARVMTSNHFPDTAYVFIAEPKPADESYEEYRQYRVGRLTAYCRVATLKAPNARQIIGLAIDSRDPKREGSSEDLLMYDASNQSDADIAEAKQIQEELGILLPQNVKEQNYSGREFPEAWSQADPESSKHDRRVVAQARRKRTQAQKRKNKIRRASQRRNRNKR